LAAANLSPSITPISARGLHSKYCRYRPHATVKYVARVLAFKNESTCLSWLNKLTIPLVQIKMKIDNVDRQVWAIECKDVKVDVPER
jgi:hypothetical protein